MSGEARALVAIAMLLERIKPVDVALRETVDLEAGSTLAVTIPDGVDDAGQPRTIEVGSVNRAKSTTTAVIGDRAAWGQWVRANHPEQILQRQGRTQRVHRTPEVRAAVTTAALAAQRTDVWADTSSALLDALEVDGYTLVKLDPPVEEVAAIYEQETLKLSQKAGQPVAPGGEIPEGVKIGSTPGNLTVRKTKDAPLVQRFIGGFNLAELAQGRAVEIERD